MVSGTNSPPSFEMPIAMACAEETTSALLRVLL